MLANIVVAGETLDGDFFVAELYGDREPTEKDIPKFIQNVTNSEDFIAIDIFAMWYRGELVYNTSEIDDDYQ